jgi:hypothetical protein
MMMSAPRTLNGVTKWKSTISSSLPRITSMYSSRTERGSERARSDAKTAAPLRIAMRTIGLSGKSLEILWPTDWTR